MAARSIFDCGDVEVGGRPQIIYDDEDLFAFGSPTPVDEADCAPKNVSISISNVQGNDGERTNSKRKAHEMAASQGAKRFRTAHHKVPNIQITANGRRTVNNTTSHDQYVLEKEIGRGTYGIVYRARLTATNEAVAVKRLTCQLNTKDTDTNYEFINRECNNLKELMECTNIVQILMRNEQRTGKNELQIDFLFEYCPHDLRKIISTRQISFQLCEIKTFLRQMLYGLDYMHAKSIMHRDFKTENLLLTVDGVLKIADFGLSCKITDPSTVPGNATYTPTVVTLWYRAPEIILGDGQYDESVDMWSLGCIMGEFWARKAILQGSGDTNQITLISTLCGTMTPENWPDIVNLRQYRSINSSEWSNLTRKTRVYLKNKAPHVIDDQANIFFDKLLQCNPKKRLDACSALNDSFFFCDPLPCKNLKKFMVRALNCLSRMH